MKTLRLNGSWSLYRSTVGGRMPAHTRLPQVDPALIPTREQPLTGRIPGSVYSYMLDAGRMHDPFDRDYEYAATDLTEDGYTFERTFDVPRELLEMAHQMLRFDGIDTLARITLNGHELGLAWNMHRRWEFDVRSLLKEQGNVLQVELASPNRYIAMKEKETHLGGSYEAMRGFPHLRKTHCMFGWDWGARLPDEGIWRDVTLQCWEESRIEEVRITQEHTLISGSHPGKRTGADVRVRVTVHVRQSGSLPVRITLTSPDQTLSRELEDGVPFEVEDPQLWWPHGLGDQPLYTVTASLISRDLTHHSDGEARDLTRHSDDEARDLTHHTPQGAYHEGACESVVKRIGLRTQGMRRVKDQWGETFAQEANGQTYFAMGADYVPEDHILSRLSYERSRALLEDCVAAGFNSIRLWGGAFYQEDWFYDLCDELGLAVWQDLMFACANFRLAEQVGDFGFGHVSETFEENIRQEIRENVLRIRHHACIALISGNNEMEQFALEMVYEGSEEVQRDYLRQNEVVIPEVLTEVAPEIFYWPSSPSSGGNFDNPRDENRGDVHYWEVWHSSMPVSDYRRHFFRYLSEFGFQGMPDPATLRSFSGEEDLNMFSRVMELHQRNSGANGKIMQYLSQTFRYPLTFDSLTHASQLLQADAIRYGVEHFRRNRDGDRCMGAVYWQLNDIWPVISWSSIDYFGRWKALHHAAARFFAPVMVSCEETGEGDGLGYVALEPRPWTPQARLHVTNETWDEFRGQLRWSLRGTDSRILQEGVFDVTVPAFSGVWMEPLTFPEIDILEAHLCYRLEPAGGEGGCPVAFTERSALFTAPKYYHFADPDLTLSLSEDGQSVTVTSHAYARGVWIRAREGYMRLEDNFFDMEAGTRTVQIHHAEDGTPLTEENLTVCSVYEIGR